MAKVRAVLFLAMATATVLPAQDPLKLYEEGRYMDAARALRKALEHDKDDALLNYNLALTLWRKGDADEAETAAEKAATLSEGELDALRDGILGNLRFEAALKKAQKQTKAEPRSKILEAALELMVQARKHYQRGALRPGAGVTLARNLERALRKEKDLEKQLEEQKKKEEEERKQKEQDKKDEKKKDEQKKDEQKKDQPKEDQQKPKEQPEPEKQPPGKLDPEKQLTKEQKQRLLEKLKQIEAQLQELQKQKQAQRPKVKKDW